MELIYYCFTFRDIIIIYFHNCCAQVVHISKLILEILGLNALGFLNISERNIEDYEVGQIRGQQIRDSQNDAANYVSAESSENDTGNQQHLNLLQVVIEHFSPEKIPVIINNFCDLNELFPDSPPDVIGDTCKMF